MVRRMMVAALLVACSLPAMAQDEEGLAVGKKSITGNALIATVNGNTVVGVMGQYGVVTAPKVEVGPTFALGYGSGDGSSGTVGLVGGFIRYRLPSATKTVPYFTLGLDYAFSSGDVDINETIIHGGAGIDTFIRPDVSFFVDLQALKVLKSGSDTVFMSLMGLRLFFD